jgi:hypothetical protein
MLAGEYITTLGLFRTKSTLIMEHIFYAVKGGITQYQDWSMVERCPAGWDHPS